MVLVVNGWGRPWPRARPAKCNEQPLSSEAFSLASWSPKRRHKQKDASARDLWLPRSLGCGKPERETLAYMRSLGPLGALPSGTAQLALSVALRLPSQVPLIIKPNATPTHAPIQPPPPNKNQMSLNQGLGGASSWLI